VQTHSYRQFLRITQITLILVYIVIVAGSVVRATGSGMGCPDWPKCFGHWIPPTHVSQLPPDYQRFFRVQEQSTEPFNALKTWTEYGNRLAGALLGVIMFVQLIAAFRIRKTHSFFLRLALAAFLLTGMEGVLGAIVVYKNLKAGVVTIHMFLSLIILVTQAFLAYRASLLAKQGLQPNSPQTMATPAMTDVPSNPLAEEPFLKYLVLIAFLFTTIQILLGTQVRESVDLLIKNFDENTRGHILDHIGMRFAFHASFALVVTLVNIVLMLQIGKNKKTFSRLKTQTLGIGAVLFAEMIVGTALKLFAIPAVLQPVHLLLAALLFGLQWSLVIRIWMNKKIHSEEK
jgi:cytochrome c oxidase assembly protein subunit 15